MIESTLPLILAGLLALLARWWLVGPVDRWLAWVEGAMKNVETEPLIEKRRSDRTVSHTVIFPEPVDCETFLRFVKDKNHFGYHPTGYGGKVLWNPSESGKCTTWTWVCSNTCD